MSVSELEELKRRVQELREKLETVTDAEWQGYVKVHDILAGSESGHDGQPAFRCAMLGIFETPAGPGEVGEYDAGAVQRFAGLGG